MPCAQHCEEGFASRDGWVVVDDTLRPRFDRESVPDWTWVKGPRPEALSRDGYGGVTDLYFFGWGLNHTATMGDWVKLSGEGGREEEGGASTTLRRWATG